MLTVTLGTREREVALEEDGQVDVLYETALHEQHNVRPLLK
jgi:hypothetical protein